MAQAEPNKFSPTDTWKRGEYGWFVLYISSLVIAMNLFGVIAGVVGAVLLIPNLYKVAKNRTYSQGKKLLFSAAYIIGCLALALAMSTVLVSVVESIWGPTNLPAVSSTTAIPIVDGFTNYQNQLMTINWLRYPEDWSLEESLDKLEFILESPDRHADIMGTLYAEDRSLTLSDLYSSIEQGMLEAGVEIADHRIENVNGKDWILYDYKLQIRNRVYEYRAAVYIVPLNDNRQFFKLQLESDEGYFAFDTPVFAQILSSIVFAD